MAAHPIVVVDHGSVRIPDDLQSDPRFRNGSRLQLVPVAETLPITQGGAEAWDALFALRGILKNSACDLNAELEAEKQRELAEEER